MLIQNKSPRSYRSRSGYVVSRKGALPLQRRRMSRDEDAATVACRGLLRWYCVRWHCNAVGGFVRGLPAEPLDTSRHRNKIQGREGGREGRKRRQDPLQNIEKISSWDRGERAVSAGMDTRGKKARIKWTKVERDREFGRVRVFLDAVCANVTAFKVEYIARMYPRCTRSGLRLTCVTYSRKLYSNRGTFCARKCGYKLQLYGGRKLRGIHDCNLWGEIRENKKYNNKIYLLS